MTILKISKITNFKYFTAFSKINPESYRIEKILFSPFNYNINGGNGYLSLPLNAFTQRFHSHEEYDEK